MEMLGKEISAYPFSVKAEKGGDPFDPENSRVRTGPWSTAAFLVGPVNDTGDSVEVGIWESTRELPGYARKSRCLTRSIY